ncbi:hypothetical protein GGI09_003787 [Coemansia sp. S100]|nr:hypothetical protein GGI09_003787 [Coemansia sp. S100]
MMGIVPQTLIMGWIQFFFSGFILIKLPFPLGVRFKQMLQSGIMTPNMDVRWVSSLSWYFINLFGLRGVFSLILGGENSADGTRDMTAMSTMGAMGQQAGQPQDYNKQFLSMKDTLSIVYHEWDLENVEQRVFVKYGKQARLFKSSRSFLTEQHVGVCRLQSTLFWRWDWERDPCIRAVFVDALPPVLVAAMAWKLLGSPMLGAAKLTSPPWLVGSAASQSDNRMWIGPLVAYLALIQALVQAVATYRLLFAEPLVTPLVLAAAAVLVSWLVAAVSAVGQFRRYLQYRRNGYFGLFGPALQGFVAASLVSNLAEVYFAFFVRARWHASVDSDSVRFLVVLGITTAVSLLLLIVRDLPKRSAVIALPEESELLMDSTDTPSIGIRRLTHAEPSKQKSPEVGSSILSNALFCWVNGFLELGKKRQPQQDDLYEPPSKFMPVSAWARFDAQAKPGRSLLWQLLWTFKFEIAEQAILNPIVISLEYAQPFIMQQILRFIDSYTKDHSIGLRYGFFLAGSMLVSNILLTFVEQQQAWHSRSLSIYVRNIVVFKLTQKTARRRAKEASSRESSEANGGKDTSEGRAYNVLTTDVSRLSKMSALVLAIFVLPSQQIVGAWYMYHLLGLAGVVGALLLVVVLRISRTLIGHANSIEEKLGSLNDQRLATTSEVIRGIASVKLFGWGSRFIEVVGEKRAHQLKVLWQRAKTWSLIHFVTLGSLPFINFAMFAIYSTRHDVNAETIFTAVAVFMLIQRSVDWMPGLFAEAVSVVVSFRRIESYLSHPEAQSLDDRVRTGNVAAVGFQDAYLTWNHPLPAGFERQSGATTPTSTDSVTPFSLSGLDVLFPTGQLSLIGGPTGSGKSSVLSALIGEMTLLSGQVLIPTSVSDGATAGQFGGQTTTVLSDIAYVSQEPWLRNATIRDNILFGETYCQDRYEQVLRVCALIPDLRILPAGDMSEVGERGITLSGGQKQRVALARAIYSSRRILLIDDCLSAVDAHTGKHILHKCLLNDSGLMRGRTRILVTHHMPMCLPHCQFVVLMRGGVVEFQGPPTGLADAKISLCASNDSSDNIDAGAEPERDVGPTQDELNTKRTASAAAMASTDANAVQRAHGQIVEDEVRLQGLIKLDTWRLYLAQCGGWPFIISCLGCIVATQLLATYKDYYLATRLGRKTGSGKSEGSSSGDKVLHWLVVYLAISFLSAVISTLTLLWTYRGSLRASVALHDRLLRSIVYATPRFLETTPIGRMMARFAKDMQVIDTDIMEIIFFFLRSLLSALITLVVISSTVPLFTVVGLGVLLVYADLTWSFMQAQRECKRLEATSFAPMISLYSEMIPGCDTIRAFDMHQAYMEEMRSRFTAYLSADFILRSTRRWLGMRIGLTSSMVSFSTTMFILLSIDSFDSGLAGFVLIYAVNFWTEAIVVVRRYSDLELSLNCVERAHQYMVIDQEAASNTLPENRPTSEWPSTGSLAVRDLVVGYTSSTPVLHRISFTVQHGEKIGVVGRTGAGKSTLSLALLRFIEATSGQILLDGVDISTLGLEELRQRITIIPQDPVLFDGTIRFNLDPFSDHSDALLLDALRRTTLLKECQGLSGDSSNESEDLVGLSTNSSVAAFVSLDDLLVSNGQNLSLGQRQLVALARALVRRSKLVIMDEATASVDFQTDENMQKAIHGSEFADSTLLCIAHRLRTIIDYDRVLVLDDGKVIEFDTPDNLINREGGSYFRWLCENSGEFGLLQSLAKSKANGIA